MNAYPAKVDANQPEIVDALRRAGATVQHLHTVGHGCPDIAVGYGGRTYLLEIKRAGARMTPDEVEWHERWQGHATVVYCVRDALDVIGACQSN